MLFELIIALMNHEDFVKIKFTLHNHYNYKHKNIKFGIKDQSLEIGAF